MYGLFSFKTYFQFNAKNLTLELAVIKAYQTTIEHID